MSGFFFPPSAEVKVLTVWNDSIALATPTDHFSLFFFPSSITSEIILVSRSSCGMSLLMGGCVLKVFASDDAE